MVEVVEKRRGSMLGVKDVLVDQRRLGACGR